MRDDFDSVVADRFKALDDVPVPDTWSRVLDRVPVPDTWSRVPFTKELATTIDLETPVPNKPRQKGPMRGVVFAAVLAAAAVVAIALVATRDGDDGAPADQPSPTVTVPPTTPPRPLLGPGSSVNSLPPGTYFVDEVSGTPTPRISATIGAGWWDRSTRNGWDHITKMDDDYPDNVESSIETFFRYTIGYIGFSHPAAVFSDACHPTDGFYPGSVATVDGFVTALREQQGGWVDVTAPSDISVDGYLGKAFQRTAPADMSDCTTRDGGSRFSGEAVLPSWESADGINGGYQPGQIETLWVLDINGTVVVISTELSPGPSATDHADFADTLLDSIRIDRP